MIGRCIIGIFRGYQLILAPLIGPCCRFTPSCSNYGIDAIRRHGPRRGLWLALRRILRCRPLGACGFDPVPTTTIQPKRRLAPLCAPAMPAARPDPAR